MPKLLESVRSIKIGNRTLYPSLVSAVRKNKGSTSIVIEASTAISSKSVKRALAKAQKEDANGAV